MSYKKTAEKETFTKREEIPLSASEASAPGNVNTKALERELTEKGVSYQQFSGAEESWRKRALKDDYAEMKLKHKWLYDQPIKADVS